MRKLFAFAKVISAFVTISHESKLATTMRAHVPRVLVLVCRHAISTMEECTATLKKNPLSDITRNMYSYYSRVIEYTFVVYRYLYYILILNICVLPV